MTFKIDNLLLKTYFFEYFALALATPTILPTRRGRSMLRRSPRSIASLALLSLMKGCFSPRQWMYFFYPLYTAFFLACRFMGQMRWSLCRFFFVVRMFHSPVNSDQIVTDFRYSHRWLYQRREYGLRASLGIMICFSRYYLFQFDKTLLERFESPSIVFGSSFYATFSLMLDVLHRFSERSLLFQFLKLFSLE